jgi:ABC-type multidrug transport system fused ATPase/permease subunit
VSTSKNNWYDYVILKNKKYLMAIILVALAISSYLGFLTPRLIADLYGSYDRPETFDSAIWALGMVIAAEYVVQVAYNLSINKYMQHLIQHVRSISYSNWILSYEAIGAGDDHKYPLGEVLARLISDTEALMELVGSGSFKIFIDFAFIISCLVSFLTLNTTSGAALITAEVLACAALLWGSKYMAKIYMAVRKSTGAMSRTLANLVGGLRLTYFTPNNRYASHKAYDAFEDFLKKQLKANVWDASYFSIAESLFPVLLALLVIVFPYSNIVEMAILAAIIDLIQRSITPIKDVSAKISSIQRAKTGLFRIQEFNADLMQQPSSRFDDAFKTYAFKNLDVNINRFEYPSKKDGDKFLLQDIHFQAGPGELIGIVGLSGSGKSTLLKILSTDILCDDSTITMETESNGKICFHGADPNELAQYKRQVSIVSQDSHVFSESMQFNITLGEGTDESFDKFWSGVVADIPYLQNWSVKADTIIRPKDLSLGQKQLISALRSCYLTKPIVLFDEISSGLDSELELALRKLVLMIQEHSLTLIVAHRIETIVKSNQILVMDQGRLQSTGTHDELMQNSATYQEFVSQLKSLH